MAKKRYSIAVSILCFAANVFHPLHGGRKLTQSEMKKAMERVLENRSEIRDDHVSYFGEENKTITEEIEQFTGAKLVNFALFENLSEKLGKILDDFCRWHLLRLEQREFSH